MKKHLQNLTSAMAAHREAENQLHDLQLELEEQQALRARLEQNPKANRDQIYKVNLALGSLPGSIASMEASVKASFRALRTAAINGLAECSDYIDQQESHIRQAAFKAVRPFCKADSEAYGVIEQCGHVRAANFRYRHMENDLMNDGFMLALDPLIALMKEAGKPVKRSK